MHVSIDGAVEKRLYDVAEQIDVAERSPPLHLHAQPARSRRVAVNGCEATHKLSSRSLEANLSAANLLRTSGWEQVPLLWSTRPTPTTVSTGSRRASLRLNLHVSDTLHFFTTCLFCVLTK